MRHLSHLNSAMQIIQQYDGKEPFAYFIKNFFRQQKKFGSTDRKTISNLCYSYFRLGHALANVSVEEKMLTGFFLCNENKSELLQHLKPQWNEHVRASLAEKLLLTGEIINLSTIFPWKDALSVAVDHLSFCKSFFVQPDLFLRIRPGNEEVVIKKLDHAKIEFRQMNDRCVAIHNSTRLEEIIEVNKEVVIQDFSSQQTANFFALATGHSPFTIWDCCAASGGKSIMLFDLYKNAELTVSDIRKSILVNLEKRFAEAGIKKYHAFETDLADEKSKRPSGKFDLVLVDAPCTGSGTWSRTPEAVSFFDEKEIEKFNALQKKIVSNAIPFLKENGQFVYITCSVFKKENEEIVDFIQQKFQLKLQRIELLKGYESKADSMFAASFTAA